MTSVGSDRIGVSFHGVSHTHLDALAHVTYEGGKMYNGYTPQESIVMKEGGHAKNSIYNVKNARCIRLFKERHDETQCGHSRYGRGGRHDDFVWVGARRRGDR
jgi:hypothetical protein